jgi:hypothetical protein
MRIFGTWASILEFDAYGHCVVRFRKTYHKWAFVVHILLVNLMSKLMNVCLMKTQIFRWSDRHATPPMVLVAQVVVTHHRHHPWHRQRHFWERKPTYCAGSCRCNSRWTSEYNSWNRDLHMGQSWGTTYNHYLHPVYWDEASNVH